MKFLIDTHVFIWALTDPEKLSLPARAAITNTDNDLYVSCVSFWEIAIKLRNGRLDPLGRPPSTLVKAAEAMGFITIELSPLEAASHGELAENTHFDPFDRMLIWQAISRKLVLVSKDKSFRRFASDGLELLW